MVIDLCVWSIDLAFLLRFSIGFWNCFDGLFVVFIIILLVNVYEYTCPTYVCRWSEYMTMCTMSSVGGVYKNVYYTVMNKCVLYR